MRLRGVCLAICCGLALAVQAMPVTVSDKGVAIDAGSLGPLQLDPPVLMDAANKESRPIEQKMDGGRALFTYPGGVQLALAPRDGGVTLTFLTDPAGFTRFRFDVLLPFTLAQGGTWRMDIADAKAFPESAADNPFLFQGQAGSFTVIGLQGKGVTFTTPPYTYHQLQDNRKWNWKIFQWLAFTPLLANVKDYTLGIADADAGTGPVTLADQFGQSMKAVFPGKLAFLDELRADVARQQAYFDGLTPPATDTYGGLPDSGKALGLRATGFFHVEHQGKRWLLVDPDGNATFHLGICSALSSIDDYTHIAGREPLFAWLPPYQGEFHSAFRPGEPQTFSFYLANLIRKYGTPYDRDAWAGHMVDRYRKWGFNAAGAFTAPTAASQAKRFPYVLTLPLGEWDGHMRGYLLPRVRGVFDPFNDKALAEIDRLCAERVPANANDPLLVGYFLANEQAFEDIPKVIPSLVGDVPAKARLVRLLQDKYATIDAFNTAWGMQAASFDALATTGLPVTTPAAYADMQAYLALFLDTYYRVIADTFHKYDTHHLLLGNRWQPSTANNRALCAAAGKYMDVISVNYYTLGIDKCFLASIYTWCGEKPLLLSEFHYTSPKESGLPGGMGEMATQRDRGLAYRNYVEQSAATGTVVGIEWFSAVDQALTGRFFDTENGNIGLVSVTDRPYTAMLAEMMKTNYGIYDVLFGKVKPFVFDDPRFNATGGTQQITAPHALPGLALDGTKTGWPGVPPMPVSGSRAVIGQPAAGFSGAFRACWDATNLYLMAEIRDVTPGKNTHTGDTIWNGDAVEVFLGAESLDQGGPMLFTDRQLLLSGAGEHYFYANAPKQYPCTLHTVPAADGAGYTLTAAIPFAALGVAPKPGLTLRFDLALDDSADGTRRDRQLMWNGIARNSSDRTHWGLLTLGE